MATAYDVVWYWVGGSERGEWRGTMGWTPSTRESVERSGYVAVDGRRSIGRPDTPPHANEIRRVLVQDVERIAAALGY